MLINYPPQNLPLLTSIIYSLFLPASNSFCREFGYLSNRFLVKRREPVLARGTLSATWIRVTFHALATYRHVDASRASPEESSPSF